jgi:hypothetical protein
MSDSSPILLIIDPHQSRFSEENEHLVPSLAYLQSRYSTAVVATRKGAGPLAFPLATHAMRRTRTQTLALSALRGSDCSVRPVHVSAPDLDVDALTTLFEMARRKIGCMLLADLCGSYIDPQMLTAGLDYIMQADGVQVVRAVDYVPRERPFLPASDRDALESLEAQLVSGEGGYDDLKRALEILTGSGEKVLAGVRGLYRPPPGRAAAARRLHSTVEGIDWITSASLYRIANGPAPGQQAWTYDLLATELVARCMVVSISADQVRRHLEVKERDFGVANPLARPMPAEQVAALPVSEQDPSDAD